MKSILLTLLCAAAATVSAQTYNQIDETGQITQRDETATGNFNKHSNDTTGNKEIPKGIYVWTVDRKFGDITPAVVDTMQHMYMNSIFNTGLYGEYNTTGNNYTARLNRIVIDRPLTDQFIFTQPYSYIIKQPDRLHFTNTLSPITNISYDNCGNKTNGEDHIDAKFAVNANKKIGFGFDLNYAYARGYYANQSTSHFGATLYGSYRGDRYSMHAIFSTYHEKAAENGGITDDSFRKKKEVIRRAIARNAPDKDDPVDVLAKVGGFDLAAMCGAFLGAAEARKPVVIDGFISAVAALCAVRLCPLVRGYLIPSHASFEIGYQLAMKAMELEPMFLLGMRLGEGSGCPLAFQVLEAACAVINDMATFDQAGIDDGYLEPIRQGDRFTVEGRT